MFSDHFFFFFLHFHQLLKPMMLRRLKEDVEKNIAPKEETIIEVGCLFLPFVLFSITLIKKSQLKMFVFD